MRFIRLMLALSALCVSVAGAAPGAAKVGLVIDKDGRNDKGFNAAAVQGLERAQGSFKKLQTEIREVETPTGHEKILRDFAKAGFNLVIALGEPRAAAVQKVAAEFPKVSFAIVDAEVKAPNVRSILFREQDGSYLVGAIAAATSKTGKLGFVGGMDIPVIRRYEAGFEAGARNINPKVVVLKAHIGKTPAAFGDKEGGKKQAAQQFSQGADVVFAVSGGANQGVFDAAAEAKKYAIGVSNQNWLKPGTVLTSMRKRVDIGIFMTCQDAFLGGVTGEVKRYGLSDRALDYVVDQHNKALISQSVIDRVNQISEAIIDGKIQVPEQPKR